MDFDLTSEQRMIRDLARTFSRKEIAPVAAALDRDEVFPHDIYRRAQELGLLNLTIDSDYGGAGLGVVDLVIVAEQLAWSCTGVGLSLELNAVVADALLVGAEEPIKEEYLGRLARGQIGCYALTEPGAGSDVAGIETTALRQGDHYIVNGSKTWISNATEASFAVVFATSNPDARQRGITALVIEMDSAGVSIGRRLKKLGQRASPAAELRFDNVEVPVARRLGAEGRGFEVAMQVFDRSRPMIAALALGLTARCLDEALTYAGERHTMGRPIIRHQAVGHKLAEMAMRLEAGRLLTYEAAWMADAGRRNTMQVAFAKTFATDTATWAASEAIQIFGGMGYSRELPLEKLYRDAKVMQIYEGTNEIQRNIMVRELSNR